jgi:hypothetical protein
LINYLRIDIEKNHLITFNDGIPYAVCLHDQGTGSHGIARLVW